MNWKAFGLILGAGMLIGGAIGANIVMDQWNKQQEEDIETVKHLLKMQDLCMEVLKHPFVEGKGEVA